MIELSSDKKSILVIFIVIFLVLMVMFPFEPVVAGDDFSIMLSVKRLVNTGELFIYSHPSASIVFQVIWGMAFARVLGFSVPVLHFSVFLFLPFMAVIFYLLCRELKIRVSYSLLLTLFLISVPWYTRYAFGFRTDLTYTALQIASIYFYLKGLIREKVSYVVIGSIFAALAFLTRHLGVLIALSCFLAILNWKFKRRVKLRLLIGSLVIPLFTFVFYNLWLLFTNNVTVTQIQYQDKFIRTIEEMVPFTSVSWADRIASWKEYFHRAMDYFSQTIGLIFPLLSIIILSNLKFLRNFVLSNFRTIIFVLGSFCALYLFDILLYGGKITLGFPIIIYESEKLFPIPWDNIWKFLVGAGLVFFAVFLSLAIKKTKILGIEFVFLFLSLLAIFLLTLVSVFAHDQYIMPILPIVILLIGAATRDLKINKIAALLIVSFLILDSVQITKLVYQENAAAQKKALELVGVGVLPRDILPGKNHPWHFWLDYEDLEREEINKVGGNRKIAAVPELVVDQYKYIITPERDLQYSNVELENPTIEIIPIKSFLVKSELLFIKNNAQ